MDVVIIGLGRMGLGFAERLMKGGHTVVGYDVSRAALTLASDIGLEIIEALDDIAALGAPRIVWMMIPAGEPVEKMVGTLTPHLAPGDILVDGGNSNYRDSIRRATISRVARELPRERHSDAVGC
jgi:6-phosphogluconate dehydrogenase